MCMECVCMCEGQRSLVGNLLFRHLPYLVRLGFSLNLELAVLHRLTSQQVPKIFMFLPTALHGAIDASCYV